MISREQLWQYLIEDRMNMTEVAMKLGVHRNTVNKWCKEWDIDPNLWWKYKRIPCNECGKEVDPEKKFSKKVRIRLFRNKENLCEACKIERRRKKNREKAARYREKNREKYNAYMREYRKKQE